jgi:hypothetical protein
VTCTSGDLHKGYISENSSTPRKPIVSIPPHPHSVENPCSRYGVVPMFGVLHVSLLDAAESYRMLIRDIRVHMTHSSCY